MASIQKLLTYNGWGGPNGFTHTNFPRAFRNRNQHNVH